jgi:hypothetical protein
MKILRERRMPKRACPPLKKFAKYMLIAGILLLGFIFLKSFFLKEGFQAQQPMEVPISASDLQKQTTTVMIPPKTNASKLANIYFKIWNPTTNSWGPKMDQTTLLRTYDMGGTTLSFQNGSTIIKKSSHKPKLLGTQKKMPIALSDIDMNAGIVIKGLNTANFGTLPAKGDPSGSKVLVGLEFA